VRRDTGEAYQEFLVRLAQESGIRTPTLEQLARLDRKRARKGSNQDWVSPHDPDARITKMKDGRTHLAHKAEHAVDLETGAVMAVTLAAADEGDTAALQQTVLQAGINLAEAAGTTTNAKVELGPLEVVGDKGNHSNEVLTTLKDWEVRSYISEPERGRRRWKDKPWAQQAVYGNRRRITGEAGKQRIRQRGELVERSFAHAYETGGMRRVHLRGRENIFKRLLIHLCGFNLSLVMRQCTGKGTPRGWQGYSADCVLGLFTNVGGAFGSEDAPKASQSRRNIPMKVHSTGSCCHIRSSLAPRAAKAFESQTQQVKFRIPPTIRR
jgi:transposase